MTPAGGGRGPRSEINVTPLVDVVLVLLVIFMVVTPLLQRGKDVRLPTSRAVDPPGRGGEPVVVSITPDRVVWVDAERCDEGRLHERIAAVVRADPARPFLLKGDARVTVGEVRRLLATVRRAGARGVRIAVAREVGT